MRDSSNTWKQVPTLSHLPENTIPTVKDDAATTTTTTTVLHCGKACHHKGLEDVRMGEKTDGTKYSEILEETCFSLPRIWPEFHLPVRVLLFTHTF